MAGRGLLICTLFISAPLLPTQAYAQRLADVFDPNFLNTSMFDQTSYAEVAGSPYYGDEYYVGNVTVGSGKVFSDIPMRYNAFEDALLVRLENGLEALLDTDLVSTFDYLHQEDQVYFKVMDIDDGLHFYRVVYEGDSELLTRHISVKGQSINNAGAYGSQEKQGAAFNSLERYFFVDATGNATEVKLTRKSFLEVLGQFEELQTFIKSEKIRFNRESDLQWLLEFYDNSRK